MSWMYVPEHMVLLTKIKHEIVPQLNNEWLCFILQHWWKLYYYTTTSPRRRRNFRFILAQFVMKSRGVACKLDVYNSRLMKRITRRTKLRMHRLAPCNWVCSYRSKTSKIRITGPRHLHKMFNCKMCILSSWKISYRF